MVFLLGCMAVAQEAGDEEQQEEQLLLIQDDATPAAESPEGLSVGGVGGLVRMLLILVLVLGMIYAVVWLLKRLQQPRRPETSLISLAASQPLAGSRALHLVKVGEQVFLVGEGDAGVQMLAEITDKESLDEIRLRAPLEQQQRSFADMLTGLFHARGSTDDQTPDSDEDSTPSLDFLKKRRSRFKEL